MNSRFRLNQTVLLSKVTMYSNGTTTWYSVDGHYHVIGSGTESSSSSSSSNGWQAGYYVIVVILVYGMSIVLLIASHINRKHRKLLEDRQIDKYLKEFQVVKERSSRDSYRILKKAIIAKLLRAGGGGGADRNSEGSACGIYRCISKTVLPISTLVFPQAMSVASLGGCGGDGDDDAVRSTVTSSRETLVTEKALHDACLCNLYVIEEFDGEAPRTPRETKAVRASSRGDTSDQRRQSGREARGQRSSGSTQNVTAEINLPQRSMIRPFVQDGASRSNAHAAPTEDQYEVSVAVHASFELEEADAGTRATNVVGTDRSHRWVRTPGPVSANSFRANQTRCAVKQSSGTSFKLQQKRAKTHSQVNDSRTPNLVQISSV